MRILVIALGIFFLSALSSQANVDQFKEYKKAFPDAKPKCSFCHLDEKPKKDQGQHEPNEYGKQVIKLNPKPTADTYKQAGAAPEKE